MTFKKTVIEDDNGRVCSCCKQYKKWNEFSVDRSRFNARGRSYDCLECRREKKRRYRLNGGYAKDHEYKYKKRHLEKGDQIYFNSEIREVKSYSMKKGYIVKSIVTGEERRISTMDNHYRKNNHCIRFRKLLEKVTLVQPKETKQEVIEEKKYSIDLDDLLENGEGW